jgi:hypothetical protein
LPAKNEKLAIPNPGLEKVVQFCLTFPSGDGTTTASQPEKPISQTIWMGNAENVTWRELKEKIKAERGAKCEWCGSLGKLDLHHIISQKNKGKDVEDNLQLL